MAVAVQIAVILAAADLAWAHPGHGTTDPDSIGHQLTEWVHAGPSWTLLAATAAATLWCIARRIASRSTG
jgi:hypothetical protein